VHVDLLKVISCDLHLCIDIDDRSVPSWSFWLWQIDLVRVLWAGSLRGVSYSLNFTGVSSLLRALDLGLSKTIREGRLSLLSCWTPTTFTDVSDPTSSAENVFELAQVATAYVLPKLTSSCVAFVAAHLGYAMCARDGMTVADRSLLFQSGGSGASS